MTFPDLLYEYTQFSKLREKYSQSELLGLTKNSAINITTLLPLQSMIDCERGEKSKSSSMPSVKAAMDLEIGRIPIPTHQLAAEQVFSTARINNDPANYGGDNAFMYMLAELIDNVYQHSGFTNGAFASHICHSRGYADLSILDDGVTIRVKFEEAGMLFNHDSEAVVYAINGLSSKPGTERGYGLQSTVRLVMSGLHGQLFIVSGSGGVYVSADIKERYDFGPKDRLAGTLVTIRLPYPCPIVNIFSYLD